MAVVKIFVPTFRRNQMLQRCIGSLLKQTFTNWICEVHNDDPADTFPSTYINSLNDPRFSIVDHQTNLGTAVTFNLLYEPTDCQYVCLLEDDNWWEDAFLATMVEAMDNNPGCAVGFSNFYRWQEHPGDKWEKLPGSYWPLSDENSVKYIDFPQFKHIFHYHHANCSTIIRNQGIAGYKVPVNIRFDFIEAIHERAYPHPLLFVDKPLSNFAMTISTSRKTNLKGVYEHYMLLMDSFFSYVTLTDEYADKLWAESRESRLNSYFKLLYTGLVCRSCRKLLNSATAKEWGVFMLYNLKHPGILYHCINAKKNYRELWEYLLVNTGNRINK